MHTKYHRSRSLLAGFLAVVMLVSLVPAASAAQQNSYSAAFTLDVYGHVTEQMKPSSSERMEQYIHMLDKAQ